MTSKLTYIAKTLRVSIQLGWLLNAQRNVSKTQKAGALMLMFLIVFGDEKDVS
jgi:hypothetical protein